MFVPLMVLLLIVGVLILFKLIMDSVRGVGLHQFNGDAMVSLVETENRVRPIEQSIQQLTEQIGGLTERINAFETMTAPGDAEGQDEWTNPP